MTVIGKLLIISFDAVCDGEFERLARYSSFSAFAQQASIYRKVSSVFLTNTYPVHTSVVTGVNPGVHGVISNTEPFPAESPVWNTSESSIRAKTLWQAAAEKGIETAAVLWPVTAFSKTIKYNVPETHVQPGENQILANLAAGSKLLQVKMLLRHYKKLNGAKQPALDNFATACMADILREHAPGLALMHLTAYDSICHKHGRDSKNLTAAMRSLDRNLKTLLAAAGSNYNVILFSDHGQLNVHTVVEPNNILALMNLIKRIGNKFAAGKYGCYIECCGGSAFFHQGRLPAKIADEVKLLIAQSEGFLRFLTDEEMYGAGYGREAFGFGAKAGYFYGAVASYEKATHGYPADMPDYKVFYMARLKNCRPGCVKEGGSLLDIAPLAAKILGVSL